MISADAVRGMLIASIFKVLMKDSYQPCKFMTGAMNALEPYVNCVALDLDSRFRLVLRLGEVTVTGDYMKPFRHNQFMALFEMLLNRMEEMLVTVDKGLGESVSNGIDGTVGKKKDKKKEDEREDPRRRKRPGR